VHNSCGAKIGVNGLAINALNPGISSHISSSPTSHILKRGHCQNTISSWFELYASFFFSPSLSRAKSTFVPV
jgi:hypothetical protein